MSATNLSPTDGASLAPMARWADHQHTAHVVQFYGEDRFLLDELSRFIGNALGAGEPAVLIATKEHREGLNQRLQDWGFDTGRAVAQGRYLPLDAAETLSKIMHAGTPDPARFAEVVGSAIATVKAATQGEPRPVAAFGEMVALLWADGKFEAAIRLEQLWNEFAETHPISLHCAYPLSSFYRQEHGDSLLQICSQHTA